MFERLKRLMGKRPPRKYQVPDGLAGRVCTLKDEATKGSWVAHRELWRLIEARCPEVKQGGNWRINREGSALILVEDIA